MNNSNPKILVVDDEPINLDIFEDLLDGLNYDVITATSGQGACEQLERVGEELDVILLDRMMPDIDGIEILKKIKENPALKHIPVVLQTAMARTEDIEEGLSAGAYYYITKPFKQNQMLAIIKTAISDCQNYKKLKSTLEESEYTLVFMDKGLFSFKSIEEGKALISLLAKSAPDSSSVAMGLSELVINAVEHGNLGITYKEKSELVLSGNHQEEIERRMLLPENRDKKVVLEYSRQDNGIEFVIKDEGNGFEWEKYLEFSAERAFDPHGRGIAMANSVAFSSLVYSGVGNVVCAKVDVNNVVE